MWDLNFLTRDPTHVPCIGRQSLNYWTTREVSMVMNLKQSQSGCPCVSPTTFSCTDAVLEQRIRIQGKKDVIVGFQSVQVVKHLYVLMVLVKTTSNAILFLIMLPYDLSLHAITFIKHQSKSKGLIKEK